MYFLGADAGGTKTAFLLIDETGSVAATYRVGTGSFFNLGSAGIAKLIREGADAVCEAAGISKDELTAAGLGFPGYGEKPGSEAEIDEACAEALYPANVSCACDSYVAWAGSLAMMPGINIIAGTGANCYGVNERGDTARSSGWGARCDEGSCGWIGARVIQLFTKQSDGRLPRTALYEIFRSHFNIENDTYFIHRLNEIAADATETAKLQLLLESAYDAGDSVAAAVYNEAAAELACAIHAVAVKLGWESKRYTASHSGGLFKAGEKIIRPLAEVVAVNGGILKAPRFTPEQGACLTALRAYDAKADFTNFKFIY
jgi:N-acetylglucosamine kinase-like BadF-type ATPase